MDHDHAHDRPDGHALLQSKALASPSRSRILQLLRTATGPMTAQDIAAGCGLHHSTVQQHLVVLADAGLVESRGLPPQGRGRPKVSYVAVPSPDSYRDLSRVFVSAIDDPQVALEIGRRHGAGLAPEPAGPTETIRRQADRMGFAPTVSREPDGSDLMTLHRCPIADVVAGNQAVVCSLHRGIAEGVLSRDGTASLLQFVAHDPAVAGCRLVIGGAAGHGS